MFHEAVYTTIQQIPNGKVATYRYIAEIALNLSRISLPYPEIEVAYVINAHEMEQPCHRVIYTYIMFRNERQKQLLIHENAINEDLKCINYWKSPLESEEMLNKANRILSNKELKFTGLQESFYFSHENHSLAFTIKNLYGRKTLLTNQCLCNKCSTQRMAEEIKID
ncbi:Alkylated DNA nucleotide flippase Atl1, participates in nucleotide excision repair, Ada-like DNA-binding domain [Cnuella takakiae]|uniref:Alkylated DNA nucleotide flippase Atl1, participates in nucleotide excision repair, Ada-like DNA-binding domain n=3 Tax=Cnuella takakiae TaxID=1302690 RepID=A0A1M5HQQ6_9BACT|nr:Alkylated DNA nucleotide flippase Atl1, participates in nucleotide excision repair, Ada-like DNA-binding domain [Cnuella takakiae]